MAATSAAHEEAAYIASEYIYSIDNLPNEVSHLLQEIKHRDTRAQELQQEIDKDSTKYIRHSLKAGAPGSIPPSPSAKAAAIPGKISAAYAEIQTLCEEKEKLARTLVALVERTRTRLDIELTKVRALQGEPPDYAGVIPKPLVGLSGVIDSMKTPVFAMTESLKNALAGTPLAPVETKMVFPSAPPMPVSSAVATSSSYKRRKVTTTTAPSIKVPGNARAQKRSASPTVQSGTTATGHQRSRLSRQVLPPAQDEDEEMDAEGDEEVDGDDADGDDRLYCYCQKQSYGDMIACDNEGDCPYEWFHLSCAGIKGPTPERWYCDHCKAKLVEKATSSSTRKGRKK
ncbi:hypothetical protein D9611_008092 [Ephemerocybe angulata]|uniref:Chromatin modification-related protein n=1 Tax=Ephemerocybe angulata TaxID=980116 RepID=A0A8H5BZ50_9AGAR|nr:hypothetical protein D9611_008092 [Tulosesus angulatus]